LKYHIEVYRKHRRQKTLLLLLELDSKKHFADGEEIGNQVEEVIVHDISGLAQAPAIEAKQ